MGEKFLKDKDAIVRQIKLENTKFIKRKPYPHNAQRTVPGIRLTENEPSSVDDTLSTTDASAYTLNLSLIVDPIVTHEHLLDCNSGESCAHVDTQGYFYYVRAVKFEDFNPPLGTLHAMDLLSSIHANWDEDMDHKHTPRDLDDAYTSHMLGLTSTNCWRIMVGMLRPQRSNL
jgi:hypothetical protein